MKNFILVGLMLLCANLFPQVGINTSSPNGASILDIVSTEKGVLIPRLTSTERDSNLADNDIITVPPNGVVNSNITPGLLIFNTTANAFEYWDGLLWRRLNFDAPSNKGAVKIIGPVPSDISLEKDGGGFGPRVELALSTPLEFAPAPTTTWPANEINPGTAAIYTAATNGIMGKVWRENNVQGQVHVWRLIIGVYGNNGSASAIMGIMRNPLSGFEVNSIQQIPHGTNANPNIVTFYFYTIADNESLDPGKGYKILLKTESNCFVRFVSLTRVSL